MCVGLVQSGSHWKFTCFRNDISDSWKVRVKQQSLTHSLFKFKF